MRSNVRAESFVQKKQGHDLTHYQLHNLWARRDLNPQPTDYESVALTVELQARISQSKNLSIYEPMTYLSQQRGGINPFHLCCGSI